MILINLDWIINNNKYIILSNYEEFSRIAAINEQRVIQTEKNSELERKKWKLRFEVMSIFKIFILEIHLMPIRNHNSVSSKSWMRWLKNRNSKKLPALLCTPLHPTRKDKK